MKADVGSREPMSGLDRKNPCARQAPPALSICRNERTMNMKTKIYLLAAGIYLAAFASAFGQATFTKITAGAIVNDGGASFRCAWGDYDNDGFLDLLVTNFGGGGQKNFLYHNNRNGIFARVIAGP